MHRYKCGASVYSSSLMYMQQLFSYDYTVAKVSEKEATIVPEIIMYKDVILRINDATGKPLAS